MGYRKEIRLACFFILCAQVAFSQFTILPIPREVPVEHKSQYGGRTKDLTPMPLPFWDDFSFSNVPGFPHDTIWAYGASVSVNLGLGINPPSLGVATFDGLNAQGVPYDVNDVLAKGIADSLVSRPIAMDLVPAGERGSVFLSFYYQFRGNGEPPDPGDQLRVLFRNSSGAWVNVLTLENNGTLQDNEFIQTLIPVNGDEYYHNNFQFNILSYGRLSGPYDTWNIDYVYLNKGRNASDTSYPDRTINIPLTSMINGYYAMPFDHFMENPSANLTPPLLSMHNLEFIPGNGNDSDVQPINYDSQDSVFVYRNNSETIYTHLLDNATTIGNPLQPLEFRKTPIQTLPNLSNLAVVDSAARIKMKLWINSGDNVVPSMADPLGDYNTAKYSPIDFRVNDTTNIEFTLDNYYAYDDGTAEYGAALNQPGALLAYLFEMKTAKPDTIVSLDLYFPTFGENIDQSIQIQILKDLTGDPGSFLHTETVKVVRGSHNNFWRLQLSRFVGVRDKFYIGWKQSTSTVLAIGLDKNTNSGDKIFFNLNGAWEPNILLTGSLMIRPIFGKFTGTITGLANEQLEPPAFYPNPSKGNFMVSGKVQNLKIYTIAGQEMSFTSYETDNGKMIQMNYPTPGLYILQLQTAQGLFVHRIKVE